MEGNLLLEDGRIIKGDLHFTSKPIIGEVVFNTSMSGYQEIFTDPSYAGQIVVMTYPLIGNYGIHEVQSESFNPAIKGIIVKEIYDGPLHPKASMSLMEFLKIKEIPTLTNADTRAITKHIRSHGAMTGILHKGNIDSKKSEMLFESFSMKNVSHQQIIKETKDSLTNGIFHVVLIDYGYKKSIKEELEKRGIKVTVVPFNIAIEKVLAYQPDGIVLSNGPGDPEDVVESFNLIKELQDQFPMFGICLGHQVISLVNGAKCYKMSFGHRGANHSVKDLKNNKVFLSSQNHSYAVDKESVKNTPLKIRFTNVNDQSVEGLEHKDLPVLSVQFHPEANSGPEDSSYLFDEFITILKNNVQSEG